ncbi:MAG: hypothetical protein JXB88_11535 [Spirochaetales bacterium]|nr:hypothetical protein [Spirochaetales bacterium]
MEKEVQIQIGMRWNHPSFEVICRETERFLSWLTQFETTHLDAQERIPIHWNIPSYPYLEIRKRNIDDLVTEIKTRIQNRKDIPISMGYSGGAHPLLTIPELEKECEWSLANPWNSGIKDTFGKSSNVMMPYTPDIWRAGALGCYEKNGFSFIGINADTAGQLYFKNRKNLYQGNLQFFLYLPLTSQFVMQCKKDVKKVLEETGYTLPLFFDCMYIEELVKIPFNFEPFTAILDLLMSKYTVHFTSFTTLPSFSPEFGNQYSFDRRDILPNYPLWRQNAIQTNDNRDLSLKTTTTTTTKDILQSISPLFTITGENWKSVNKKDDNANQVKSTTLKIIFPPEDRINTADMQGHVTLAGNTFSVQFLEGKIRNFVYKKKKILTGEKVKPYIRFSGVDYVLKNMNAFSIAGDRCRGLREIRRIEIDEDEPPGSQLIDYIFVEDFPYLIVTSKVTYPYLPANENIEQLAFFELPLFFLNTSRDQCVQLHIYSDNTRETYSLKPEECTFSLIGNTFIFSKDSVPVIVGFPGGKGPDLQILNVKIIKHKKDLCFMINIGGCYFHVPASRYSRVTEVFSFFLGVCSSLDEGIPAFPSQVLQEIPPNMVSNAE